MKRVEKSFAYITHRDRILVFEHADFPNAGIQVPAGTIRVGESPSAAAVREAREETGISDLSVPRFLGIGEFDARPFGKEELHRRHFFHLHVTGDVSERWRHYEQDAADGSHDAIAFDLYWLPLTEAADRLIADHGALIRTLLVEVAPFEQTYRYLENDDVHVLDCAGKLDVAVGLERLHRLSAELEARPARDGVHRLLIDFRHTEWVSEEAHRELSRATRRDFGLNADNPALRLAFVFCGGKGAVSDSEHWFDDDNDALAWLLGPEGVEAGDR